MDLNPSKTGIFFYKLSDKFSLMANFFWWFGFPGVVLHELSHYVACILTGVKVFRVKFFSLRGPAYVVHARPNVWQGIIISTAPFFIGAAFGIWLLTNGNSLIGVQNLLSIFFYWLGISVLYFSFPSSADARNAFNGLIGFYGHKIFGKNSVFSKFFWTLTLPFIFLPFIAVVGILLLFNFSPILRSLWVLFCVILSFGKFF